MSHKKTNMAGREVKAGTFGRNPYIEFVTANKGKYKGVSAAARARAYYSAAGIPDAEAAARSAQNAERYNRRVKQKLRREPNPCINPATLRAWRYAEAPADVQAQCTEIGGKGPLAGLARSPTRRARTINPGVRAYRRARRRGESPASARSQCVFPGEVYNLGTPGEFCRYPPKYTASGTATAYDGEYGADAYGYDYSSPRSYRGLY